MSLATEFQQPPSSIAYVAMPRGAPEEHALTSSLNLKIAKVRTGMWQGFKEAVTFGGLFSPAWGTAGGVVTALSLAGVVGATGGIAGAVLLTTWVAFVLFNTIYRGAKELENPAEKHTPSSTHKKQVQDRVNALRAQAAKETRVGANEYGDRASIPFDPTDEASSFKDDRRNW